MYRRSLTRLWVQLARCAAMEPYLHAGLLSLRTYPLEKHKPDQRYDKVGYRNMFNRLTRRKSSQGGPTRPCACPLSPAIRSSDVPSRLPSTHGIQGTVPDVAIAEQFSSLHQAVVSHVQKYYIIQVVEDTVTPHVLAEAFPGANVPSSHVISLLGDPNTRPAILAYCIAWASSAEA
jgi:hypothetical protein